MMADAETKKGAVTIRIAKNEADLDSFADLVHGAHQESRYKDVPYDLEKRKTVWRERIVEGNGSFVVLLASFEGKDVGVLIATLGSYLFTDALQAQCYVLFVRPENRSGMAVMKLLHAYRVWATEQGVTSLTVHIISGVRLQSTDKLLRRVGFEQTGGNYELLLEPKGVQNKGVK